MNIIYLAHTQERIWRDTVFSMLTLIDYLGVPGKNYQMWVFTDNPGYFNIPGIKTVLIDRAALKNWFGDNNFIHRAKIKVLQKVMDQTRQAVIMIDGDTLMIKDPSALFKKIDKRHSLMHKSEGAVKNHYSKLGRSLFNLANSGGIKELTPETIMYNSGVVGIDPFNFHLGEEVLKLSDRLFAANPLPIMEQLAQSIILKNNSPLIESDEFIFHWWGRGLNVEPILISYFEQTQGMDLDRKLKRLPKFKEEILACGFNQKPGFWHKLRKKLIN